MRLTTEGDSHDQKKKINFGFYLRLEAQEQRKHQVPKNMLEKKKQMNQAECLIQVVMRYRLYISLHNKARSVRSGTTPLMSYLSPMWPSSCLHGRWSVGHSAFQQATSCEIWLGCRNTVACIERLTRADCVIGECPPRDTLTERGTVYGTHLEHIVGYNLWNTCE